SFLRQGAAVMFVSHDLGAVTSFCDRALVLDRGHEVFCGSAGDAVGRYYEACRDSMVVKGPRQAPLARTADIRIRDQQGREVTTFSAGDAARFGYRVVFEVDIARPSYGFSIIRAQDHLTIFETSSTRLGLESPSVKKGDCQTVRYDFRMNLSPGEYVFGLHVRDRDALRYVIDEPDVARIMVDGVRVSGGMAHLDPRVEVEEPSPEGLTV
ncbi:MAG: Wzt carbohydrate-binding domain-containing protein, partial [Dehalococcoidia bacterium]